MTSLPTSQNRFRNKKHQQASMLLVMVVGNRRGRIDAYYLLAMVISTIYVPISITIDHLIKYYARQPSPKKNRP